MIDRYRNYQPQRRQHRRRKSHSKKWLVFIAVIAAFIAGKMILGIFDQTKEPVVSSSKTDVPKAKPKPDEIATSTWNELETNVNAIIGQNPTIDISVSVIDANTSTSYNFGIQDNYAGASTTKVLTAAAFLSQVEAGTQKLDAPLGNSTARQQIKQMINRSNNESWALLNKAVGYTELEAYAKSIGANSYQWSGNIITAADEALILKKLYKRELINNDHTALLLSYMQNTNNEDMIPVVIPTGATFYHKYGQISIFFGQ